MNYREIPAATINIGNDERSIALTAEDLCRHTIVFGNSGSGKTTRAFNPILAEMLGKFRAGGLVICAKSEAVDEVVEIAQRAGRDVLVIEPGSPIGLDLLCGSPDVDSMYLRDTFGTVDYSQKQWVDAGVARMKNALRILQAAGSQYYTFDALTNYIFDEQFSAITRVQAMERLRSLPHGCDEAWTIREAMAYEDTRYRDFTPETRRAVLFACSQLLEPLRDVAISKTFAKKANLVSIESVFSGQIIVLHVPRSKYERAAQAVYTMAKRRFFTALENRRNNPALEQDRPVVFAVDEYQLCISESDVQSLGIIRSAGCMVLATTQGVSSLYTSLSKTLVDAALQNFTHKIFFKTDDYDTLATLERATQHAEGGIGPRTLFKMNRNQAICHVTAGDQTIDEVLTMKPLFILPHQSAHRSAADAA